MKINKLIRNILCVCLISVQAPLADFNAENIRHYHEYTPQQRESISIAWSELQTFVSILESPDFDQEYKSKAFEGFCLVYGEKISSHDIARELSNKIEQTGFNLRRFISYPGGFHMSYLKLKEKLGISIKESDPQTPFAATAE